MKVGDKVWYQPTSKRCGGGEGVGYPITITAVGRKWAETDKRNARFNLSTGYVDGKGYSSPGRVWPSKEAYELHRDLVKAWDLLRDRVAANWSPPAEISAENVRIAMEMLRV